jgi:EpsI family protein
MINRRDVLLTAACFATTGAAYAMVPRRRLSLLGDRSLDQIIPRTVADWTSTDTSDLVSPTEPGSLASELYGQTLGRVYRQASSGAEVALLMAYGAIQSDDLMVHRPEKCYPAFGFAVSDNRVTTLALPGGAMVPARRFVAQAGGRSETILYWVRLGEYLPTDKKEQQFDRMKTALSGFVGDGILVRFSVSGPDAASGLGRAKALAIAVICAVRPADRLALIGTSRARAMAQARV